MKSIETRRSIRKYDSKPVSEELVQTLLSEAERTQTMGNLQLYSVVETRSQEMKQKLAPAHYNQPMVTEAPVVLTICADFHRTTVWCQQRKAAPGYNNLLSFMNAATDALLYTQTLSILAEDAGLGLCFLGTTLYNPLEIVRVLGLPKLVFPVATLTLGWPAEHPLQTDRLSLPSILHSERYHDYTPADIDRYFTPKEALPESQHFVEINHKETLAQVFTDLRYTRSDNEQLSTTLIEALRHQGFLEP